MTRNKNRLLIYISDALRSRLPVLPPRSLSRICQQALLRAVEKAEAERDAQVSDAFDED